MQVELYAKRGVSLTFLETATFVTGMTALDFVFPLSDVARQMLLGNDVILARVKGSARLFNIELLVGMLTPVTSGLPVAVRTPFNLTQARANWTTVNVTSSTELQAALLNAAPQTLIKPPIGVLGGSWGNTTLTWPGVDHVYIDAYDSIFSSSGSQRLFIFQGTTGANNGILLNIDDWADSGTNRAILLFDGFSGKSIDDPFRITGSRFENIGILETGEAIIDLRGSSKYIYLDHSEAENIHRMCLRLFLSTNETPPALVTYWDSNAWETRLPNASEMDFDEGLWGSAYDCGIAHCTFSNTTSEVDSVFQLQPGNDFARGSEYINCRTKILYNRFINWKDTGTTQTKSSGNEIGFFEMVNCDGGIYQRGGNNNHWHNGYFHGTNQKSFINPNTGDGHVYEDFVFHSSLNTSNPANARVDRWGDRPNNTTRIQLSNGTYRRLTFFAEYDATAGATFRIGEKHTGGNANLDTNADHADLTVAKQEAVKGIVLEDLSFVATNQQAFRYEEQNYGSFTFPDANEVTMSGTKVWVSGTGSVGNVADLDPNFELNVGSPPDHTVVGPVAMTSFTAGKQVL